MNTYSAYGLTVRSAFELPELPAATGAEGIDLAISRDDVEPVPDEVESHGIRRMQADPNVCRATYDGIASFSVESGTRIRVDPESAAVIEEKLFRRILENELMGILLHQRGCLVLHASAVAVDGHGAVFLGPRGAGKSTTGAAFHLEGHTLLEDDVVAIRFDDDGAAVLPGVPQLRLKPEAVDALDVTDTAVFPADGPSEKRYKLVEPAADPVPLAGCYFLADGDDLAVERLAPREALFDLMGQTYYSGGLLSETETTDDHFQQCSAIVDSVSVGTLERPRRYDELPSLVEFVADELDSRSSSSHSVEGRQEF